MPDHNGAGRSATGGGTTAGATASRTAGAGVATLTKKSFTSDQEVRWCPGCGDYAILSAVQAFMPELGIEPRNTVFVSGIGCSGRFTYYMDTYGMHGIHGRAPALATGIAAARPDLSVWVVTGDGDGLSIGGNHLIHALRRNVNIKILLFNNQIYGLTKGQYSPTSEEGKVTKSTPFGSLDHPFNPIAVALGAEASFVARTLDNDRGHLTEVLRQAAAHPGAAFVEIYQNCNVFNDGAFDLLRDKESGKQNQIRLEHGRPIVFNDDRSCVYVGDNGRLVIGDTASVDPGRMVTHDAHDPSLAFSLAHISQGPTQPTCIGIFHESRRSVYGEAIQAQARTAVERLGEGDVGRLLRSGDTWEVTKA
jgi:2-oxoglutarate/2-oxoacid ferredoxin oxidoreductase subunit beta